MRAIPTQRSEELAEYKDPLAYMDARTKNRLRMRYRLMAILLLSIGLGLDYIVFFSGIAPPGYNTASSRRLGGGLEIAFVLLGLPPYALYRLFTINRSVANYRRRQLISKVTDRYIDKK